MKPLKQDKAWVAGGNSLWFTGWSQHGTWAALHRDGLANHPSALFVPMFGLRRAFDGQL